METHLDCSITKQPFWKKKKKTKKEKERERETEAAEKLITIRKLSLLLLLSPPCTQTAQTHDCLVASL